MPVLKFMTERDVALIQGLLDKARREGVQFPTSIDTDGTLERRHHQAPEVYIALPPAEGIPALEVNAGTGGAEDDIPGEAICDIYVIVDEVGGPELRQVSDLDKIVYNLSEAVISQQWITVHRTKYGRWIAVAPAVAGGPFSAIYFYTNEAFSTADQTISVTIAAVFGDASHGGITDVKTIQNPPANATDYMFQSDDADRGFAVWHPTWTEGGAFVIWQMECS